MTPVHLRLLRYDVASLAKLFHVKVIHLPVLVLIFALIVAVLSGASASTILDYDSYKGKRQSVT